MNKSYMELIQLNTFRDRFKYLMLSGYVGAETFGKDRYLNQRFYKQSYEWKEIRKRVILRDQGYDLGCETNPIVGRIIVHHINPITIDDILNRSPILVDLNNLISVSEETHRAIHYGNYEYLNDIEPTVRFKNDTCPWKK